MSKPHIHLSALSTPGSFTDVILSCQKGLEASGYSTSSSPYTVLNHAVNIIFCSQLITWKQISAVAQQVIVYNWEPCAPDNGRFPPTYIRQMQHAHVWDYNEQNIGLLKRAGVHDIHYVPMGYVSEMQRVIPVIEQDIDVLFYGIEGERRKSVLDAIRAKGLNLVTSEEVGFMSDEVRDQYIARTKVVLNMHFFERAHVFEVARVGYLLANKKAVVAEVSPLTHIEPDIHSAIAAGTLDELPQLCWDLVHDNQRRFDLEQRGFDVFSKRDAQQIMQTAMSRYLAQAIDVPVRLGNLPDFSTELPKILQLGAGVHWRFDYCNIDTNPNFASDIALNLGKALSFDEPVVSWRFGQVILQRNYFETIIAHDFFQRTDSLKNALSNCLALLQDGGVLKLHVGLDLSEHAWLHADNKRVFNEQTWTHVIDAWQQYSNTTHRFETTSIEYAMYSDYAKDRIAQNGGDWGMAFKKPRLIDATHITLRKRALTDDEIKQLPQSRFIG